MAVSEPQVDETLRPRVADTLDPRVERSRELVLAATLELLGEIGYGELTVEAVAARSGVAKSTIYRHWGGKGDARRDLKRDLVFDAFTELKRQTTAVPPPGPVRDRVVWILRTMLAQMQNPLVPAACVPALIEAAAHCEEMASISCALAERGARPLITVLDEAVADGELPGGTDTGLLADALMGPILVRRLFRRPDIEPGEIPTLVDQILPPQRPLT